MKFGVPWKVSGIRADARETAREAARRAGMSVGEWLNTVILDSADAEGVRRRYDDADDDDSDEHLFAIHERIDELTRQMERISRRGATSGPEAYAPPRHRNGTDNAALADAIARLDQRLEQLVAAATQPISVGYQPPTPPPSWSADIDQAVAEITARQQALDADPAAPPPRPASPAPAPLPAQNLGGLEQQLRHITAQIESLRRPAGLEEGLAELRGALGDIARNLAEAMPRRAIEALEAEIRTLAGRLDNTRSAGVDPATLAAVERGLAEVRDTLRTLTPAENLAGFHEAVGNLAQKVDILAASAPNPGAFQQLDAAISALRGIVSHVASNEALAELAGEVRALAQKIDQVASSAGADALGVLEKRVAHIADALEMRAQNGGTVPPQLEAVIRGLGDKIERIQSTRADNGALGHLEGHIAKLAEKLDASGARFSQLEAIERGLADLLLHIEKQKSGSSPAPHVDGLQRDIARTQTSLEAVHGTLGHVVDRLAIIETDMRGAARPASPMPQAANLSMPRPAEATPPPSRAAAHAQAAAAMARANPQVARKPIEPNLPPDYPLEPGYDPDRTTASPAHRIAASEAALGAAKPPVIPDPGGKSNFIAAARRAARAAASEPSPADLRAVADYRNLPPEPTLGEKFKKRMRSLFVGTSVILLIAGGLRLGANFLESGEQPEPRGSVQAGKKVPPPAVKAPASSAASIESSVPAPAIPDADPSSALPDTTGTVSPRAPAGSLPPGLSPALPNQPSPGDKLPAAIGGPVLRTAAASGNAAAAYEVGLRYAEGRGVAVNAQEAARWFDIAAKQNLAPAQFRLGGLYEKGLGVKKDIEMARRLYRAAADQGNAKAMHNLAVLYAEGAAVKPDYRSAAQWFRLASDHGVADSQYNLAILYARGLGVDQNLVESYKWFALAAAQGDHEAASKRDEIAKRLDSHSLTAARLAVQAFTPQPQPPTATTVNPPPGGWDAATSSGSEPAPAAKPKPRASGPIRIGSR